MPRPVRFSTRRKRRSGISPKLRALLGSGKTRAKPRTEEHDAQVDLFRDHIVPRLHPDAVAFAIGNGGKRHPRVAKAMKDEGVTPGVPDIFLMHAQQVYFLEIKKPKGGVVSKDQKIMMARLVGAGAVCAVAAGLEAAIAQLEQWGLLVEVGGVDVGSQQQEIAA